MRNEHEKNLNILRGILHACEEGAIDETDGSEGAEPWTEYDRREARKTADWIRRTFFARAAARERAAETETATPKRDVLQRSAPLGRARPY